MSAAEITTAEELDALPVGTELIDDSGERAYRSPSGQWEFDGVMYLSSAYVAAHYAPLTVLYRPDAPTVAPADPREVAHIECDCVPDLGPSHCHLCSTRAGREMPWAEAHPTTVTAEQRDALARVFLAERSGVDQVDFYEHQQDRYPEMGPSPLWVAAQAAADRGLAALGIEVQR